MGKEVKSFKINGKTITKQNFLKFARENYGSDDLKDYLQKILNLQGRWRLDHWSSDNSFNAYQVGNEWVTIYKEHRKITDNWLKEL